MKKTASIISLVFLLIISCICAVGCSDSGSDSSSDSIVGKWADKSNGQIMELKSDGTIGQYYNGSYQQYGTYTTEGSSFTANIFGQEMKGSYSISGDTLKMTIEGSDYEYTRVADNNTGVVSQSNDSKVNAATLDAACKDYYAYCVSGQAPGEGTTRKEISDFTAAASIQDALNYANLSDVSFDGLYVNSSGTITSDSSNADSTKSAILNDISASGSLKALYT